ncbi:MAG: PDZ domain-containing protein, partial [Microbacteriaceae bacterium]|nr:PDZ domain-containing protein [Microbacteriaceae bacterium]
MDFLSAIGGWLILLLGLAISIGLHELGHLLPAKKFGVKVTKYMIGFGPTLFSRKRGETEYGIKAIPLGGYIQMVGMLPPGTDEGKSSRWRKMVTTIRNSDELAEEDRPRAFYLLKPWQKLIVMFGGPFANLLIAFFLTLILFSGFGAYDRTNEIRETISCLPTAENPNCDKVGESSPAALAGLKAGDKVIELDGQSISRWTQVDQIIRDKAGTALDIVVLREGQELALTITPKKIVDNGNSRSFIGVYLEVARFPQSPIDATVQLGNMLYMTGEMIVQLPVQAVHAVLEISPGSQRDTQGAISIVGLGQFSGSLVANSDLTLEDKILSQLGLMLSLNVALFVFNMVPLVPLDGGHIAGAIYEAIKRGIWRLRGKKLEKPVDTAMMMPVAYFVAALLLA